MKYCLIVEDDPILSEILRDVLEDMGHRVIAVHTVLDARAAILRHKFELVLLDYNLPDGNSLDLSEQVSFSCPNSRIILLTGSQVFPKGEHGRLAPAIDWVLRKPVSVTDLRAVVEYAAVDAAARPTVTQANS